MHLAKIIVGVTWLICLGSFFIATESTAAMVGRAIFWLMAVAHVIECGVFFPRLKRASGPLAGHLFQTFLFGVAHLRGLDAQAVEPAVS